MELLIVEEGENEMEAVLIEEDEKDLWGCGLDYKKNRG